MVEMDSFHPANFWNLSTVFCHQNEFHKQKDQLEARGQAELRLIVAKGRVQAAPSKISHEQPIEITNSARRYYFTYKEKRNR